MPRACTVCTSPSRRVLDDFISQGGAVASASEIHGIHESSIRRHLVHSSRSLMGEARATTEVGTVELFEELVAALHDVVTVRRMAMLSGQAGLALRAASAGRETILSLVGLLGVVRSRDFLERSRFDDFAALVRHPDLDAALARKNPIDLAELDALYQTHLPLGPETLLAILEQPNARRRRSSRSRVHPAGAP